MLSSYGAPLMWVSSSTNSLTLAKQAITDGVALNMGLTYVDAINSLQKKSIELWQTFWDSSSESRGFYLHSVMPRIGCTLNHGFMTVGYIEG